MTFFEFISKIIESIAWPGTVLFLVYLLKEPLKKVIPLLERMKYKDFELYFKQQIQSVKENVKIETIQDVRLIESESHAYKLAEVSPRAGIQEAWRELEIAAKNKIAELQPEKTKRIRSMRSAIEFLENSGALIPSTARALQEMNYLRNQAAHLSEFALSKNDAVEYIQVANNIRKQLEAITELPKVKHTALTLLISEFNHLIDTKKYFDITISEVHQAIEDGNILRFLNERAKGDIDLSLFLKSDTYGNFEAYYVEQLQQIYNAYGGSERRKWGIENLGLCLLIAWTNEIIQLGAGWYPSD